MKSYFFQCQCDYCTTHSNGKDEEMNSLCCQNTEKKCTGTLVKNETDNDYTCNKCGSSFLSSSFLARLTQLRSIQQQCQQLEKEGEKQKEIECWNQLLNLSAGLLGDKHKLRFEAAQRLTNLYEQTTDYQSMLSVATSSLPLYTFYYPSVHPVPSLHYALCGKLAWYLEDCRSTVKFSRQAIELMKFTHRDGGIKEAVAEILEQATMEQQYLDRMEKDKLES